MAADPRREKGPERRVMIGTWCNSPAIATPLFYAFRTEEWARLSEKGASTRGRRADREI